MSESADCPSPAIWKRYVRGKCRGPKLDALNRHLQGCALCQKTVRELNGGNPPAADALADAAGRPRKPLRRSLLLKLGLVVILAVLAFIEASRHGKSLGKMQVETVDPSVHVLVESEKGEVTDMDPSRGREIELPAGKYRLRLPEGTQGLKLNTDFFNLDPGGRAVVNVRRVPPPAPKAAEPGR